MLQSPKLGSSKLSTIQTYYGTRIPFFTLIARIQTKHHLPHQGVSLSRYHQRYRFTVRLSLSNNTSKTTRPVSISLNKWISSWTEKLRVFCLQTQIMEDLPNRLMIKTLYNTGMIPTPPKGKRLKVQTSCKDGEGILTI
jgi:hypothetical protein